jgi:DNA invertase Pin-like site-specific DNA recombinase
MLIGYARVSTDVQVLDRQLDALSSYGVLEENIHTEKMTGTRAARPQLEELMRRLRSGDVVVIESLSRLGRSARDLLNLIERFNALDVELVSLSERIETRSATGRLVLTVLSALAEYEASITRERVLDGLAAARARGKCGGRPKLDERKLTKALRLYDSKAYSVREIAEMSGISIASLYRGLERRRAASGV